MAQNVAQNLIATHLASGEMTARNEIALRIDQLLTDRPRRQHPLAALGWLATGGSP
jgi:hypothetical protein